MYMAKNEIFLHFARKSEGFEEFMVSGSGNSGNEDEGLGGGGWECLERCF